MIEITAYSNYHIATIMIAEANMEQADVFKHELITAIDSGQKQILISFENVQYIDSSFLGALVASLKYALTKGGDLAVYGLNENILNLFEMIRMDKVFKVFKVVPASYEDGWVAG
ncbi:STAS domain-containing protein [Arcticibacter sp.]|jgi:anti-sigma B factor antagonist|uniref:STAS domain-containing protein n=1 Tax=Arcticibacter sp. TaxID=1872630 RepID=UPI00388D477A